MYAKKVVFQTLDQTVQLLSMRSTIDLHKRFILFFLLFLTFKLFIKQAKN